MATQDTELIVVDIGGGCGGKEPPARGDGGGDGDKGRRPRKPPQRRYSTAIMLGMISILVFFLGLCSAFIVLKHVSQTWVPLHLPRILWLNTAVLLLSSYTLERARRRLSAIDFPGFRKLCTCLAALPHCCTWLRAILRRAKSRAPQPWKLLRTTGILWMACGCFCCCFSIWEDNQP